jgi:hypothetical protein
MIIRKYWLRFSSVIALILPLTAGLLRSLQTETPERSIERPSSQVRLVQFDFWENRVLKKVSGQINKRHDHPKQSVEQSNSAKP